MSFLNDIHTKYVIATANRYWHGSPKDHGNILKILPYGSGDDHVGVHDFGGVFLAKDKSGHIHGDRPNFWYFIDLKDSEILSLNDLYHRHYKDPKVKEVLERLLNIEDDDIEDDEDEEIDARSNAEFIWDEICQRGRRRNTTRINHLLGDRGEWEIQMIQGQITEALGFKAVEMTDERGPAYLLVGPSEMQKGID
jgi:hypothetical protein